jgi:hypothetical protein
MKLFTIEEANELIPTVRQIVKVIQRSHHHLYLLQGEVQQAAKGAESGGGGILNGTRYASLLIKLVESTSKLESLGIQLKDFSKGLVDFPSMRNGRVVLLCWQLGEGDQIEWWHEIEAGFAGRQPL